jgi:pilus assembly protein CpaB
MSARALVVLALILGSISAYTVSRWVGIGGHNGAKVVLATTKINPGSPIEASQIKVYIWPNSNVPEGAFSKVKQVVGRVAQQEILPGDVVSASKLASPDSKAGLEAAIASGKRAITVKVNEVIAVAGFAMPGSYIDVIVNVKDNNNAQPFSKTVLSHVKVLAVAQDTAGDPNKPKVVNAVTLELTPKESEALDLARNVGSISLSLRNQFDQTQEPQGMTRYGDLFPGGDLHPEAVAVQPTSKVGKEKSPQHTNKSRDKVEVIRGTNVSEAAF